MSCVEQALISAVIKPAFSFSWDFFPMPWYWRQVRQTGCLLMLTDGNHSDDSKDYWASPWEHWTKQNPGVFQTATSLPLLLLNSPSLYAISLWVFFPKQWLPFLSFMILRWEQVILNTGSLSHAWSTTFLPPSWGQWVLKLPAGLGSVCVSVMCCSTWLAPLMGNLISDNHGLQGMPTLSFTPFQFMSSFRLEKPLCQL